MAGCQHRGIVVFAHHPVGHKHRIQRHSHCLNRQNNNHRQRQRRQLPQLQAHQGHRQEQRQADVTQHRHRAVEHAVQAQRRQAIAQDHADKQHANEGGQFKYGSRQQLRNDLPYRQTDGDQRDALNQHQRCDHAPHIRLFKRGRRELIVRRTVRGGRVLNQIARHRSADQAAQDEAEGCASHGHFGSVGKAIAFNKQFTPRRAGTVAAGKGNRTGQQPHQRVEAKQLRHADSERVLQQQQPHHHNQERPQHFAAGAQAGEVGVQADSGKESQHQRIFEAHIEIDFDIHAFL